ncbi:MAG: phosphoribosylformylglycinamidine synthase subunit PurS [Atribacterota bacterium]|nr:phosphoribosylformylglycinamidine synthase subunit PurS [Atribacterota bacterium]
MWVVKINIILKKGILDAQGKATQQALLSLGFDEISSVRIGKLIELQVKGESKEEIAKRVTDMCQKILVNPIIEDFEYEIEEQ